MTRSVVTTGAAAAELPAGAPVDEWEVAAVAPTWGPAPGEDALAPVPGRLALHEGALVFRADDVVDDRTGEPLVAVVTAESVTGAGPLSPGTQLVPGEPAGAWMPRVLRRVRCPGFAVTTSDGPWAFDCPHGVKRANEVARRYG